MLALTTARRTARPAALWGSVFGATVAATMSSYRSTFPTPGARAALVQAIEGNPAFEALFGVTRRMDTVAGYTAYKTMFTLVILAAVWGLLTATRVLRGEEDAGRWELFLAGPTTRGQATTQVVGGLAVGLVVLFVPTAVFSVAAGKASTVGIGAGTTLYFSIAVISVAAMFMSIGVLMSELAGTRHDANLLGAGVIAASYLVRMAADSDPRIGWLRWASPLGWVEELRPLTGSRAVPFIPIVALVVVPTLIAVRIAARRDLGASAFRRHDRVAPRTFLLGGEAGLTVRLTRAAFVSWVLVLAATGLVFGLVTQAAGKSLRGSPTLERVIARLGAKGAGAETYLGFVFLMAAGLVMVAVGGQISALRAEETSGHLDNLLSLPVARWRWLVARLVAGLTLVVIASGLTGVAAWVGAATQHAAVGLGDLLEAGLNVAPPAVFLLGIGALAFGLWPRGAVMATYGLVVWSFLVETIAGVVKSSQWLRDTSPLLHITPAPAADPNWTAAAWLVGLGIAAAAVGMAAFSRRDLVGD